MSSRRVVCLSLCALVVCLLSVYVAAADDAKGNKRDKDAAPAQPAARYVRFQHLDTVAYGLVEGDRVWQLKGDLFNGAQKTDATFPLADVKLLVPTTPKHVLAMAGNYKSHLKDAAIPEKFKIPQPFYKTPACLVEHEGYIVIPKDAKTVHYEAELVIVIGKKASKVPREAALDYVFGVTCGNDVSERDWQKNDVQWWRAKASDTFGPCGPFIATGLDYDNLLLTLRQNGQVKQQERTSQFIHNVADMVSFISQYVTLEPGDLIYTGTPGTTETIKPGDVIEVELEGVGVLRNRVRTE